MSLRMLVLMSFGLAMGMACGPAWADFVIAENGEPRCVVRAASPEAKAPAEELAGYLRRIVGARFPRVGRGPALVVRVEPGLGRACRIGAAEGQNLVLAGATEQDTFHAVYAFLYRLGCRWFVPGEIGECVPSAASLSVKPEEGPYTPPFSLRVIWYAYGNPDGDPEAMARFSKWGLRNGLNPHQSISHGHNLLSPIPEEKYLEEHPEYYALYQGERRATQPCTTNPEVIRLAIEHVLNYFRGNAKARTYSLCAEDNGDFCECENCRALDPEYPGLGEGERVPLTDRMLVFYNEVAEAVAKEFPERYVTMYAYTRALRPPVREKVHANLIVFFCATFDPTHSVAQPISESRRDMLEWLTRWCELSDKVYIYEYDPIPYVYGIHTPLFEANALAMHVYRELEVKGLSFESYKSWASKFPNYYFNAQMMWNPDRDPDAVLGDLCEKFFGAASAPMYRYYRALADSWAANPTNPGWGDDDLWKMFPPDLMATLRECLAQAEAAELSPVERERVQMVRLAFDFTDNYLATIAEYEGYWSGEEEALFDYERALEGAERCEALIEETLATNNDFILAEPARGLFVRRVLGIKQKWGVSEQFRAQNEWVRLPEEWPMALDPERVGLQEEWFAPEYDDSGWEMTSVEEQWYEQKPERRGWRDLYAWGRARFVVPEEWAGRPVRMFVGATDEQGWFYVNGKYVYHHPEEEMVDSWAAPCDFDITELVRPGEENVLAVLVYAEGSLGGVWRPVYAYTPRQ